MSESKSFSVYNGVILEILRSFYGGTPVFGAMTPLINDAQWIDILAFLRFHKLIPIAYHVLTGTELWETIPNNFKEGLKQASFENTALILLLGNFMDAVASALEKARIPFYIIKGPALALEFYRPSDLRPYTDIDIVIPFNRFNDANAVLNDLGFSSRGKSFTKEYFDSVHFSNDQYPGFCIDLQWESVTSIWTREPFLSSEEVWDRIRLLRTSEGRHIPVLSPMFLIPFLCTHLVFHRPMALLIHLIDLALAVRGLQIGPTVGRAGSMGAVQEAGKAGLSFSQVDQGYIRCRDTGSGPRRITTGSGREPSLSLPLDCLKTEEYAGIHGEGH